MNNINFGNLTYKNNLETNVSNPQNPVVPQQDFGAINKAKIQSDVVEIKDKTKENAKENVVVRTMKNLGIKEPKKFFISLGLTIGTVVAGSYIGNKLSNPTAKLGLSVDEFLEKSKIYNNVSEFFKKGGKKVKGFFKKSKVIDDFSETLANRKAKPRCDMTRGYGRGFVSIFSLTPVDVLEKTFKNKGIIEVGKNLTKEQKALNLSKVKKELSKLVGDNDLDRLAKRILGESTELKDNREFCEALSNAIRKNFNCEKDNKKFLEILTQMQDGAISHNGKNIDVSLFKDVNMKGGGVIGSWWPVNIINSIGQKLGFKKQIGRGNLGDSLVKFNAVDGKLANTTLGKLTQQITTVPTESITNFVNDKSGMGVLLGASILGLYNNVQDAPKDKKAATIADDFVGTIGSIAIATPMAFGATYGLASMKNLKGTTFITKMLRGVGKVFGMGLERFSIEGGKMISKGATNNVIPRGLGGALRFALIMFVFSPMFSKPIKAAVNKVFGKPYDKAEEERAKQLEEQKNQIIPELGITQGELTQKLEKNPEVLLKIQNDPKLAAELQNNPKKLLELLNEPNPEQASNTAVPQKTNVPLSPANQNLIHGNKTQYNSTPVNAVDKVTKNDNEQPKNISEQNPAAIDTATYIPSSDFVAKNSSISDSQSEEINKALTRADKVLAKAEKYI